MEKIFLDQSKYYEPINTICRKYNIPFVYDWTYSLHNNMNLLIKVVNGMVIEMWDLKEIIKEFIRMFDKDLQETIIKTLEKWQEEGKLEGIINEALFNSKADKKWVVEQLKGNFKQQLLFQNHIYSKPNNAQGFTIIGNSLVMALISNDGNGVLRVYDLLTLNFTDFKVEGIEHANSLTNDGKNIYIARTFKESDPSIKLNDVLIVDFKTMKVKGSLNFSKNIAGVVYYDEHLYGQMIDGIEKIDLNGKHINFINVNYSEIVGEIGQSFTFNGSHFFYLRSNPESITVVNLEGKVVESFSINPYINNLKIGEVEDIEISGNGNIIVSSQQYSNSFNNEKIIKVFEIGYKKNIPYISNQLDIGTGDSSFNVYVDNKKEIGRPDGSHKNPFISLQDAVNFARKNGGIKTTINVEEGVYEKTRIHNSDNLFIRSNKTFKVKGLAVYNSWLQMSEFEVVEGINDKYAIDLQYSFFRPLSYKIIAKSTYDIGVRLSSELDLPTSWNSKKIEVSHNSKINFQPWQDGSFIDVVGASSFNRPIKIGDGIGALRTGASNMFGVLMFDVSIGDNVETITYVNKQGVAPKISLRTSDISDDGKTLYISEMRVDLTDGKNIKFVDSTNVAISGGVLSEGKELKLLSVYGW